MMRNKFFGVAGALAVVFTAGAAWADDWIVTIGGRAQAVVPYEGAGHDIFVPTPSLSIRRAGQPERRIDRLGVGTKMSWPAPS